MHNFKANLIIFGLILLVNGLLAKEKCPKPYSHCNLGKPGFVNVHIVPHTHDDVGWLKTVDQYYYGSNTGQQKASVQYILDTVVEELIKDPARRFVYVEIAYFWRWWNEQTVSMKDIVRNLVSEGRLEFVIGAWCMADEATPYYSDMIDQQTLGLKFILKEFGECARPRSAWQVDPFGHSRETASLFAQFGFDGVFLGRIDSGDFDHRGQTKTREGLWQASVNLGEKAQLFTGVLPNGYYAPPGFCFDEFCGDEPFMDDPRLEDYNVDKKVNDFLEYTKGQLNVHKTNNLIMTMGSDFQYSNALMQFKNIDKMIKYVNQRQSNGSNVNIFYSTTACYLYSLNNENTTWTVKEDDFFPYSQRAHGYWTGYFTSRPSLKYHVKEASRMLQTVRQMTSQLNSNDERVFESIKNLERAMGVLQHHDAVSGTERQHVTYDYTKRLSIGVEKAVDAIYMALGGEAKTGNQRCNPLGGSGFCHCPKLNISECTPIEKSSEMAVSMYNPLLRKTSSWISVPVTHDNYIVLDPYFNEIESESVAVYDETKNIPERNSHAKYDLVFKVNFNPLDDLVYVIRNDTSGKKRKMNNYATKSFNEDSFRNDHLKLKFDKGGNLMQIDNLDSKISTKINQNFCYYKSFNGNNSEDIFQASGAYIFRSQTDTPTCLTAEKFTIRNGKQFDEIHQVFNSWISQTIRLYKDDTQDIEFNWQVGPIDVDDGVGKEVIMKLQSDLKSAATFYTDSNGREILKRVRDYRPTWDFVQSENISGNYYPVNSRIFIRDNEAKTQLTLLTDRSQGGSSIKDGSLEIMVHRRLLHDDQLGVSEPLNEKGIDGKGLVVKGTLNLLFDTIEKSAKQHRDLAMKINNKPTLFFDPDIQTDSKSRMKRALGESYGFSELPPNLHLLTLMKDYDSEEKNAMIVRIEHYFEIGEDPVLSQPVTIDIRETFKEFRIIGIEELALGTNMPVEDLNERLKWKAKSSEETFSKVDYLKFKNKLTQQTENEFSFVFKPMEIRTFRIFVNFIN